MLRGTLDDAAGRRLQLRDHGIARQACIKVILAGSLVNMVYWWNSPRLRATLSLGTLFRPMHRGGASALLALGVVLWLLPLAECTVFPPAGDATLDAQVLYVTVGGAAGPSNGIPTPRVVGPGRGLEVRAVPAGATDSGSITATLTDENGAAHLELPAGAYWVYVPAPPPGPASVVMPQATALPDGTRALGWTTVDLAPDTAQSATITIELLTP